MNSLKELTKLCPQLGITLADIETRLSFLEDRLSKEDTAPIPQVQLDEIEMQMRTEEGGWGRLPTEEEYYGGR